MSAGESPAPAPPYRAPWPLLLGLVGLDYFSTLAYQPSIAYEFAGLLSPLVTAGVVLLTLIAALPVYAYIAGRSPPWQGSIAMLERLVRGWRGKFLVLILLGFAATNFVFTRTLSAADAAVHVLQNPVPAWQARLDTWAAWGADPRVGADSPLWHYWNRQVVTTLLLLLISFLLWPIVWHGFAKRLVQAAAGLVAVYLLLTLIVLGSGAVYLARHPGIAEAWWAAVRAGDWGATATGDGSAWSIVKAGLWLLPKLILGLSGFEISLVAMPLVKGRPGDDPKRPAGQVANTRKLLVTSAGLMTVLLLGSALVTTLLIAPAAMTTPGQAKERAIAYLAHGGPLADGTPGTDLNPLFGPTFGSIYDCATVLVLCLAGASVILGLRTMIPQYLPRFGMELHWAGAVGLIYQVFTLINLVVTVVFRASVEAQRSAYAVSVVALLCGAAFATSLDLKRAGGWKRWLMAPPFYVVTLGLLGVAGAVVWRHPGGLLIAGLFIVSIVGSSLASRYWRSTEFRFQGFQFANEEAKVLWDTVRFLEYSVLVPHRPDGPLTLLERERRIRKCHRLPDDFPVIFLEIHIDDASDFYQQPLLDVTQEHNRNVVRVRRCASAAHVITAIGIELSKVGEPPEIHFGWSEESPLAANLNFLLFGEGNVPWLVHDLLRRHEPDPKKRPRVIIG